MVSLFAPSITYRIAVGPQAGRKVFTLQTLPAYEQACADGVGKGAGFSLHAGVAARADERHKLERLCRYVSRPAVSEQRLSLAPGGLVRYQLKTPYKDGTTHVLLEPLDFLARLAALVPKPRVNLTRYHGVFAPHSRHRARVTRAGRGKGATPQARTEDSTPAERRAAMTWAQRLKRVFRVDIETCADCGGAVRIVALHRRPGGDREAPCAPRRESHRGASPTAAVPLPAPGRRAERAQRICAIAFAALLRKAAGPRLDRAGAAHEFEPKRAGLIGPRKAARSPGGGTADGRLFFRACHRAAVQDPMSV